MFILYVNSKNYIFLLFLSGKNGIKVDVAGFMHFSINDFATNAMGKAVIFLASQPAIRIVSVNGCEAHFKAIHSVCSQIK